LTSSFFKIYVWWFTCNKWPQGLERLSIWEYFICVLPNRTGVFNVALSLLTYIGEEPGSNLGFVTKYILTDVFIVLSSSSDSTLVVTIVILFTTKFMTLFIQSWMLQCLNYWHCPFKLRNKWKYKLFFIQWPPWNYRN